MKPSSANPAGVPRPRPKKPGKIAGRPGQPVFRLALLAALAGGAFLAAYGLTKLRPWAHAAAGPPGMRWVPPGQFTMGTDDPRSMPNERPGHRVRLDGFWMDEHDVTNADFRRFVEA